MASVQISDGRDRDPFRCTYCDGTGSIEVLPPNPKPWDGKSVDCPHCFDGVTPCESCADSAATERRRGSLLCKGCAEDYDEPRHSHPMGGMGHQIQYETSRDR